VAIASALNLNLQRLALPLNRSTLKRFQELLR